jgi:uncharacterized protein (DUF433 family)
VEGTRIGVYDVVGLVVNGSSIDDVERSFPDLTRAQVYECLAYYEDDHRAEIDSLVARHMCCSGQTPSPRFTLAQGRRVEWLSFFKSSVRFRIRANFLSRLQRLTWRSRWSASVIECGPST